MWELIESTGSIPVDAATVLPLEFADGCMYLVYVAVESSGDSMQTSTNQLGDSGNQCVGYGTQLEIPISLGMELGCYYL